MKNSRRKGHSCSCNPTLANADLVAAPNQSVDTTPNHSTQHQDKSPPSQQPRLYSPLVSTTPSTYLPLVRRSLQNQGISTAASDIIIRAWRPGTIKQYKPYLGKWESYCSQRKINPLCATTVDGKNFLAELFQSGVGYSAINMLEVHCPQC